MSTQLTYVRQDAKKGTILHNGSITIYRLFERDICLLSISCMMRSVPALRHIAMECALFRLIIHGLLQRLNDRRAQGHRNVPDPQSDKDGSPDAPPCRPSSSGRCMKAFSFYESIAEIPIVISSSTSSSTLTVSSEVNMVTLFSIAVRRIASPSS